MVQVPAVNAVTVFPFMEHTMGVREVRLTESPDEALAIKLALVPAVSPKGWAKVIEGRVVPITINDLDIFAAATNVLSPT